MAYGILGWHLGFGKSLKNGSDPPPEAHNSANIKRFALFYSALTATSTGYTILGIN